MSDSVVIENPGSEAVQLVFLKMHLGLHEKGMRHSKVSGRTLLERAGRYLNKTYKRGQYQQAREDVTARLEQLKNDREDVE